jgi:hypothetical protein
MAAMFPLLLLSMLWPYMLGSTPTPDFPQPAMAAAAACFLDDCRREAYSGFMRTHDGLVSLSCPCARSGDSLGGAVRSRIVAGKKVRHSRNRACRTAWRAGEQ